LVFGFRGESAGRESRPLACGRDLVKGG